MLDIDTVLTRYWRMRAAVPDEPEEARRPTIVSSGETESSAERRPLFANLAIDVSLLAFGCFGFTLALVVVAVVTWPCPWHLKLVLLAAVALVMGAVLLVIANELQTARERRRRYEDAQREFHDEVERQRRDAGNA